MVTAGYLIYAVWWNLKRYQIFLTYTYQLCLALHSSFHVCSAQSSDVVPFAFNHCLSMAKAVSEL